MLRLRLMLQIRNREACKNFICELNPIYVHGQPVCLDQQQKRQQTMLMNFKYADCSPIIIFPVRFESDYMCEKKRSLSRLYCGGMCVCVCVCVAIPVVIVVSIIIAKWIFKARSNKMMRTTCFGIRTTIILKFKAIQPYFI